jgi:hypothetical protein
LLTESEVLIALAVQEVNLACKPEMLLSQFSDFFKGKAWSNNLEEFHGDGFRLRVSIHIPQVRK